MNDQAEEKVREMGNMVQTASQTFRHERGIGKGIHKSSGAHCYFSG